MTWLSHYILNKEILPHGYNIYRKDRDTRGGEVLLAINNKFTTSQMSSPPDLELISPRIHEPKPLIICIIYIPPNSNDAYYDSLFNYLTELTKPAPLY